MTIDQLSFIGSELTTHHPTSLSIPNFQVVSSPPQVNYVETYPMSLPTVEEEHLIIFSTSLNLYPVRDMLSHLLGVMELDLSFGSLDIDTIQCIIIPFYDNLLEAMAL